MSNFIEHLVKEGWEQLTHPLIVFGTETVQNPPHKHTHSLRNGGLHGRELYNLFLIFCFCLYFKIGPRPDFDITRLCYY